MSEPLKVGVAGLGTVGSGVAKILAARGGIIGAAAGRPIEIVAVSARDRTKDRGIDLSSARWVDDARELAALPEVEVLVELIGGSEGIAKESVETALAHGKHVVTANKALVAHHGVALAKLAEEKGVALNYEAAVAGGIPIVKAMRESLAANEIASVHGILNGTCNFILSDMETTGRAFEDVLKEAQDLGYAEADPTFDIGGIDAAHKLAILASLAFGTEVDLDSVEIEGIELITKTDIAFAREFGYRIRLLAIARRHGGAIEQRVLPALVPERAALAAVTGVVNAVSVSGDRVGTVVLEGEGAGEGPTASSVLSDLIDIARGLVMPPFIIPVERLKKATSLPPEANKAAYFLRLNAVDKVGSLAEIANALAEANVSVERITQHGPREGERDRRPIVIETHRTDEKSLSAAVALLKEHENVTGTPLALRIEDGAGDA